MLLVSYQYFFSNEHNRSIHLYIYIYVWCVNWTTEFSFVHIWRERLPSISFCTFRTQWNQHWSKEPDKLKHVYVAMMIIYAILHVYFALIYVLALLAKKKGTCHITHMYIRHPTHNTYTSAGFIDLQNIPKFFMWVNSSTLVELPFYQWNRYSFSKRSVPHHSASSQIVAYRAFCYR